MMPTTQYQLLKEPELDQHIKHHGERHHRLGLLLTVLFAGASLIAYTTSSGALHALRGDKRTPPSTPEPAPAQCPASTPPRATPPAPTNPWAPLSVAESVAVHDWLAAPARGLNLTRADAWTLADNVLYGIEAYRPLKAAALEYLADPRSRPAPPRYARVTMHRGGQEVPDIKDYLVGPLPVGEETKMRELTEIYHRDKIPYNARAYISLAEIVPLLARYMAPLAPITEVCFLSFLAYCRVS